MIYSNLHKLINSSLIYKNDIFLAKKMIFS